MSVSDSVLRGLADFDPWMWLAWEPRGPNQCGATEPNGRWVVWRQAPGAPCPWRVRTVQEFPSGRYLDADRRLVDWLWENDLMAKYPTAWAINHAVANAEPNELYRDAQRRSQDSADDAVSYYRQMLSRAQSGAALPSDWLPSVSQAAERTAQNAAEAVVGS